MNGLGPHCHGLLTTFGFSSSGEGLSGTLIEVITNKQYAIYFHFYFHYFMSPLFTSSLI